MIKRDDLVGKTNDEIGQMLENDIQEYTAHTLTIETKDAALEEEKTIIDAINS